MDCEPDVWIWISIAILALGLLLLGEKVWHVDSDDE